MNQVTWDAVDQYFGSVLSLSDPVLEAALAACKTAGLPEIQVAPNQGRLLHMFARLVGARRILEIGTLGGYSAIWLARALPLADPGARMISLEYEPRHAAVARANLDRAGLGARVEVRVGAALGLLPKIEAERVAPFDLVFVDADKENNPNYFDWAIRLTGPGSLIIVDNVVRGGAVADGTSTDRSVQGTRALFERINAEPRVMATAIQTVGVKGYDGLAFIWVIKS
jgi:predicted O-methyltransferase YrrM